MWQYQENQLWRQVPTVAVNLRLRNGDGVQVERLNGEKRPPIQHSGDGDVGASLCPSSGHVADIVAHWR
jgi:hypothetical protein